MSRLDDLRELRDALRPQVLSEHSEHGLQGVSGLVGQYLKCVEQIEQLEKAQPQEKGTALDEVNARRAAKATRPRRSAGS